MKDSFDGKKVVFGSTSLMTMSTIHNASLKKTIKIWTLHCIIFEQTRCKFGKKSLKPKELLEHYHHHCNKIFLYTNRIRENFSIAPI
jgi:hypothetical protein